MSSKMLRLFVKNGGGKWSYLVKETGVIVKASSLSSLYDLIRKNLDANGFQDSVIDENDVEEYNAREMVKTNPSCCFEGPKLDKRPLSLQDAIRFTRTLFLNLAKGGDRVGQEEANRRAKICSECPANITPSGCASCSNSGIAAATVGLLVGGRITPYENMLQSCQYCGCFNRVQVWFPIEDLQGAMDESLNASLPDHCWKKRL
jgi:hypothetical protein